MRGKNSISKYLILSIIILAVGIPTAYGITITLGGDPVIINGILDMMSNRIINLGTPTSPSDAATKAYVDSATLTTIQRVSSLAVPVSPQASTSSKAMCQAGEIVTGGGYQLITGSFDFFHAISSQKILAAVDSWEVVVFNSAAFGGANISFKTIVICAKLT